MELICNLIKKERRETLGKGALTSDNRGPMMLIRWIFYYAMLCCVGKVAWSAVI